ncbi:ABC transporter permease protein [Bacillus sp. TS-2]|nr:ABC transporter permease protein [Bacillus sp. TS-2]
MKYVKYIYFSGILTWLLVLIIWQLLSLITNPQFLPGPFRTLLGAVELSADGSLFTYMGISFLRVLTGWTLGNLIAIPVGLMIGSVKAVRVLLDPVINFVRFIPPLAFITLFMLWFGIGEQSKIMLIMYATIFIVIINTMTGVLSVGEDKIRAAQNMGASKWQTIVYVIIPSSVPYIFTGSRLAMGSSFMAIVGAEMVAANEGVGFMIWNARLYFQTDWIFVGLIALGIMGFTMDRFLNLLGRISLAKYGVVSVKNREGTR